MFQEAFRLQLFEQLISSALIFSEFPKKSHNRFHRGFNLSYKSIRNVIIIDCELRTKCFALLATKAKCTSRHIQESIAEVRIYQVRSSLEV